VRTVEVRPNKRRIRILPEGLKDREFWVMWDEKAHAQWNMLLALLERQEHASGLKERSQYDSTMSIAELAKRAPNDKVSDEAVIRTIQRINEKVDEAARQRRQHSAQPLIEKIIPGDTRDADIHYGLMEETSVVFESDG
jgi:hypothetical protein